MIAGQPGEQQVGGQHRQHRPGDAGGDDHVDPAIAVEQELHDYRSHGTFSEARQVLVERNAQGADRPRRRA